MQNMGWLRGRVRAHRLVVFFGLTYLLSWAWVPFGSFFATGPLVAALIVISLADGVAGLRVLGSRLIRWRVGVVWYVAAVAIPILAHVLTIGANRLLGSGAPSFDVLLPWYAVIAVVAVRMIDPFNGPMAEEPSYRGFALPTLQSTRSPLVATTILAALVTVWHVPLYFMSEFDLQPIESLATIGCTFFYAWLFDHAWGSVLIPLLAHAVEGGFRLTTDVWPMPDDLTRAQAIYAVVWFMIGVAVVVFDWRFWQRAAGPEIRLPASASVNA
jgi:CAAX protease family protein